MTDKVDDTVLQRAVAARLGDLLAVSNWRRDGFDPYDVVTFVRDLGDGVTVHFAVGLDGQGSVNLASGLGVEHTVVAELQRQLFEWDKTVSQVGASLLSLVPEATPFRWWASSQRQVEEATEQLAADLREHGEPFLMANRSLPQIIHTLRSQPKTQVEYGTLAVCLAVQGDLPGAVAMLREFVIAPKEFAAGVAETFVRNFTERFGIVPRQGRG